MPIRWIATEREARPKPKRTSNSRSRHRQEDQGALHRGSRGVSSPAPLQSEERALPASAENSRADEWVGSSYRVQEVRRESPHRVRPTARSRLAEKTRRERGTARMER